MPVRDDINAFCSHDSVHIDGASDGPLAGLTFAAKDIFDIEGHVCSCGNPDWFATHPPASRTAPAVQCLLDAGATLVGMTLTAELVMGLTGENAFYGMPINVAAPGRVTGGSSSGSAAAVAAGLVEFALGSDTGGSVRVPASFCGIYGMRPTYDRIPLDGVMPFAPSLDTIGWFARDAELMRKIGSVLLGPPPTTTARRGKLLVATDAFDVVAPEVRDALGPAISHVAKLLGPAEEVAMAGGSDLEEWSKLIAVYREGEGWRSHRDWINRHKPTLSDYGAMRMELGAAIEDEAFAAADAARQRLRSEMNTLLADGAVLAVPAAPHVAPPVGGDQATIWDIVQRNARFNSVSPLAGLPQISLPLAKLEGLPIGLGLIAAPGADETLLTIAEELSSAPR